MEKLQELSRDFLQEGLKLELKGLDELRAFSPSAHSTRKRGLTPVKRLTVVTDPELASTLTKEMIRMGATGYTEIPCFGAGRRLVSTEDATPVEQIRIEVIMPTDVCEQVLDYLRVNVFPHHQLTVCVETVEVQRITSFMSESNTAEPVAQH